MSNGKSFDEASAFLANLLPYTPRDALANDILDARRIYMKDGVYTP